MPAPRSSGSRCAASRPRARAPGAVRPGGAAARRRSCAARSSSPGPHPPILTLACPRLPSWSARLPAGAAAGGAEPAHAEPAGHVRARLPVGHARALPAVWRHGARACGDPISSLSLQAGPASAGSAPCVPLRPACLCPPARASGCACPRPLSPALPQIALGTDPVNWYRLKRLVPDIIPRGEAGWKVRRRRRPAGWPARRCLFRCADGMTVQEGPGARQP